MSYVSHITSFVIKGIPMYFACAEERAVVMTLTLGLQLRQGLTKVWAKSEAQKSHFILPKV
jgi:hypothetical protein